MYNFYKMKTNFNNFSITLLLLISVIFFNNRSFANGYRGIKTIVIDAGHGGKDPGCHGHKNTREKDVTLAISLKLGRYIEDKFPLINVIYTRKTDVFVELNERAQIANRNNADLFICIHANAGGESAYGAETYVLGLHRTDAQRKIAERENSAIQLEDDGGEKYKDFDMSVDAIIGRQLQLSVFLDHSIVFASKIQSSMKKIGRKDRGVKQAGFLVLYKTTMPSVLIETGFLSNHKEELFLRDTANQSLMANSFFKAFKQYKNYYENGVVSSEVDESNEKVVNSTDYGLNTDELNENMNITPWFEEMDSLSWVPFAVVPMHLETGEHRVVHVWSNEFRRWKNGSTQKVALMEVFGIKDDKIDWFRQWNRNNSENEFGLRSGGHTKQGVLRN